jgi:hypothetical protein
LRPLTGVNREDFLFRSVERFADWLKFADAKAAAVIVIFGLGWADLLSRAGRLARAHSEFGGVYGWGATGSFWAACLLAVVTVVLLAQTLFPRLKSSEHSLFYFGTVATEYTADDYAKAVDALSEAELAKQLSSQAWQVARIAHLKLARLKTAFYATLMFLGAWALARAFLSLAQ